MNPNNHIQYIEQKLKYIIAEGNIGLSHSNGIHDQIFRTFVGTLQYYINDEGKRSRLTKEDQLLFLRLLAQDITYFVNLTDEYLSALGIRLDNVDNKYAIAREVVNYEIYHLTNVQAESERMANELMAKNDTLHPKIA